MSLYVVGKPIDHVRIDVRDSTETTKPDRKQIDFAGRAMSFDHGGVGTVGIANPIDESDDATIHPFITEGRSFRHWFVPDVQGTVFMA